MVTEILNNFISLASNNLQKDKGKTIVINKVRHQELCNVLNRNVKTYKGWKIKVI